MSFSKYPNNIDDVSSLPVAVDLVTEVKAEVVNRLRDAILAIEAELGNVPSSTFGTLRERLASIDSTINNLGNQIISNDADIVTINNTLVSLQSQITALDAEIISVESSLQTEITNSFNTLQSNITSGDGYLQGQIDSLVSVISESTAIVSPIVSGSQLTDSTTYVSVGATVVNPTNLGYPNSSFAIEVVLQTTNASYAASFEIFNLTEGVVVSHPAITTASTSATFISVALSVGGSDLPSNQSNVLEGRIKLASGAGTTDRAICKYAAIRSVPI